MTELWNRTNASSDDACNVSSARERAVVIDECSSWAVDEAYFCR